MLRRSLLVLVPLTVILVIGLFLDQPSEKLEVTYHQSGAMQAMEFFTRQRSYPAETLPTKGFKQAFDYSKTNLAETANKSIDTEPWRPIGPGNVGGRTLALAFNPLNPATIYAGSASGGLWRTYTSGKGVTAWHQVPTGFPVLGVAAIALAANDSNTIYIGTGEVYNTGNALGGISVRFTRGSYGIGILKSVDAGATWTASLDWSYQQQRGVQVVKVDPTNSDVVWAGTTEGTYKSTDAGQSWQMVNDTVMVTDLIIHPEHPEQVIIACGNFQTVGQGLYRTADGGENWDLVGTGDGLPDNFAGKALLAFAPSDPDIVLASIGNGDVAENYTWLGKSTDFGLTWGIVSSVDYSRWQGWFAHDVAIHPTDPDIVVMAGIDVWKSTVGGGYPVRKSLWSAGYQHVILPGDPEGPPNFSHADHHDIVFHPTNPNIIYFANDGGIFRSLDAGETFEGCNGGYQTTQFYANFSCSQLDSNLAIGGLQDNSTVIFFGNDAWSSNIGGDGGCSAISAVNDDVMYGSVQYLRIFRTDDRGANWDEISPTRQPTVGFIAPFALGGGYSSNTIYAGGAIVYKSSDKGESWFPTNNEQPLDGNPVLTLEVAREHQDYVYATTAPVNARAGVFRTRNGGTTWDNITNNLPDRYPVGLAIDPNDSDVVYLTFSGFGSGHLFKTTSGGEIWRDIGTGLPDVPTSSVVVDPDYPQQIYVGNDLGIYVSRDRGRTWHEYSTGLPDAVIAMDLAISPTNRMLRVATYGNGVYERKLLGEPDQPLSETPDPIVASLLPNYPNPFNQGTNFEFFIPVAGQAVVSVFNIQGQKIRTLADDSYSQGYHSIAWDGLDQSGKPAPSGVYMYHLNSGGTQDSHKMTLVK